jgi:thiol:disulfide interchange protein
MLDFTADWCVSCKEMERYTFTAPGSAHGARRCGAAQGRRHRQQRDDQALLRHFGIFGPPTIAFFDRDGPGTARAIGSWASSPPNPSPNTRARRSRPEPGGPRDARMKQA